MNILLINFEYPPLGGGGGVSTKQIAEELATRHTVYVLTTHYKDLAKEETDNGVHIVRVPVWGRKNLPTATLASMVTFVPAAIVRGYSLCRKISFTVINAQFVIPSGIPAAILSRLFKIPFVVSFIGGDVYDPTKRLSPHRHLLLRLLVRFVTRQAVVCTAISQDIKRRVVELHGITKEIIVTHLGLKPSAVSTISRGDLKLPEGKILAVTIGRLIPRKGYKTLLKAWLKVPNAHLLIIGNGPMQAELASYIKSTKLKDRVHLLGFVPENRKLQILRACDLYVSAAEHEGFGIVFLEAMDAGLPVVAVNNGGQKDFLTDGENALLVKPHNSPAIAAAVNKLIEDKSLRVSMASLNAKKAPNFYLDRTVALFEDVLKRAVTSV